MLKQISATFAKTLDSRLVPKMDRFSRVPLIVAVRFGLAATIPLVLLGSLAFLLNSFPPRGRK